MTQKILLVFMVCALVGCQTLAPSSTPKSTENTNTTNDFPDENLISDPVLVETPQAIETSEKPLEPTEEEGPEAFLDQSLELCQMAQELWQKGELESALQNLDQAYALIIKVDTLSSPKVFQQKEDLRYMISKRIMEIYASQNTIVHGTHNPIPLTINAEVQREIKHFTGPERRFFAESLKRSGRYRPMMLKALKEAGLPKELSWLPLVESGFKLHALSKARALGLWQFIPSTGYMYGLSRNRLVDERIDPVKATNAAIDYLKKMHRMFGDWSTVLAAYNCGEGRVLKTIRTQNINYLDNFWDLYGRLPRETAQYVPRFLATVHIVNNLKKYGFENITPLSPPEFEIATLSRQVRLKDIAQLIQTTEKHLAALNPELLHKIVPGDSYPLRVPKGTASKIIAGIDTLKIAHLPQRTYVYHRVRPGEVLSTIARNYRTSTRAIARANRITKRNFIVVGQLLKIPRRGYTGYYTPSIKPKKKRYYSTATQHTVRRGDSLWIIARRYNTTVRKIQHLNGLTGSSLRIGQRLKLPKHPKKITRRHTHKKTYYVKRGDNPFTIAQRHNISLDELLRLNRLSPASTIYPGQKLYVK